MRRFEIAGAVLDETDPGLGAAVADAYRNRLRPLCLCRQPGIPMYVARIGDQHVIKRMPFTGGTHDAACESYEPPLELSGLGTLMGNAIRLDPESGLAALRLDFSLTHTGSRASPTPGASEASSVKSEARRLSLRALLHFLWNEAGLTKWTVVWTGKRQWWNMRWHLIEAAKTMMVKGVPLSELLLVPEPFRAANKSAIEERRATALRAIQAQNAGPRRLMVLVGEIKEFQPARGGHRIVVKHMPGFPLLLEDKAWQRLKTRFEVELALWSANDGSHLIAIATFGVNAAGLAAIDEIALMIVGENWIPYESVYEEKLVGALARLREPSIKGLRYSLASDQPAAAALLMQHQPKPLALYIVPASADDAYEAALAEMIAARPDFESWIWRVAEGDMPPMSAR